MIATGDMVMTQPAQLNDSERPEGADCAREVALQRIMSKPLWDEKDLAVLFDVCIDTIRHMKSRGEIPGIVQINLRAWLVHRDVFLEELKQKAMPRSGRGRPPATNKSAV